MASCSAHLGKNHPMTLKALIATAFVIGTPVLALAQDNKEAVKNWPCPWELWIGME
jgi:hypothetical protein